MQLGAALVRSQSMPHALVWRAGSCCCRARQVQPGSSAVLRSQRTGGQSPAPSLPGTGLAGLQDELRPGRPRTHDDEQVAELISLAVQRKPEQPPSGGVRSAAKASSISKSTVGRYFALFGLQRHRAKSFKLSTTDSFFGEKVRELVGLYLNPPDKALVLWVDEKSQVQALERTQPDVAPWVWVMSRV